MTTIEIELPRLPPGIVIPDTPEQLLDMWEEHKILIPIYTLSRDGGPWYKRKRVIEEVACEPLDPPSRPEPGRIIRGTAWFSGPLPPLCAFGIRYGGQEWSCDQPWSFHRIYEHDTLKLDITIRCR